MPMTSSFAPTQDELSLVSQVFAIADTQKIGIVTGEAAVKVFSGAKLTPSVLGEIWNVADSENNGFLSKKGVAIALRLIGWAQKGERVTPALINKPGPTPTIEGITAVATQTTGFSGTSKSPPPIGGLPPFTPQDRAKFLRMFQGSGPVNGYLSAEKARDIFVKSKLPVDKLSQIWNLADSQDRGQLDATDFAIGMYFIQAAMSNQLPFIPTTLPPGLYEQAGGRSAVVSHSTGPPLSPHLTGSLSGRTPIQPQYTGIQPQYTGQSQTARIPSRPVTAALGASAFGFAPTPVQTWDVTDAEKANADRLFDNLDTQMRGFIEGDVAVPFMLESKLQGDDLAQIWDLADIHNDGRLTRDGFAVAMHLIQGKLSGKEIPSTLPPSLIPPAMRRNNVQPPAAAPKAQQTPMDLLWGDDSPTSPPAALPALSPQPASHNTGPQQSTFLSASQSQPSNPANRDVFGASSFGSTNTASSRDFLSDDHEITQPSQLEDKSAEIGNVQNVLSSTNRSLEATKVDRAEMESQIQSQSAQLSALQTQLSTAKASYETETRLLATFRERFNVQQAEIQKTREELIRSESDLSALRVEKAEIEGAFLRDKEEARDLHRRMIEATKQAESLKEETEKVKKEAKQQKGLLAIARKQLSTKEADKAKVEKDLAEAKEDLVMTLKETEKTQEEIAKGDVTDPAADSLVFAASHALPLSPDTTGISSPGKSNNPFERFGLGSGGSTPRSQSPFMPFANTNVPSPNIPATAAPEGASADVFGFSQAFGTDLEDPQPPQSAQPLQLSSPSAPSTPKQHKLAEISVPPRTATPDNVTSPSSETDMFATPPSTAAIRSTANSPSPPTAVNVAEEPKDKFPELHKDSSLDHFPTETQTDLSSQLKELDVQESDSSDEEDDVPLSVLKSKEVEKPTTTNDLLSSTSDFSFDDAFGSTPFTPAEVKSDSFATDAFGAPTSPKAATSTNQSNETLTKPSTNKPSELGNASAFSFDSAFEDDFDFGSNFSGGSSAPAPANAPIRVSAPTTAATSSSFPPIGASLPPTSSQNGATSSEFDALFTPLNSTSNQDTSLAETLKNQPIGASTNGAGKDSFDDVFGMSETSPSRESEHTPTPTSPKESKITYQPPATAPPTHASPPRVASPLGGARPRLSTSSKESSEKTPSIRHSKLSKIRLPFGKKKQKTTEPPTLPSRSQLLTPPTEERVGTPAVEDDIEPVKQLCGMGFSRTQAIDALEIHNYDVQKALNSLLGAQ